MNPIMEELESRLRARLQHDLAAQIDIRRSAASGTANYVGTGYQMYQH